MKKQIIMLLLSTVSVNSVIAYLGQSMLEETYMPSHKIEATSPSSITHHTLTVTPEIAQTLELVFRTSPMKAQLLVQELKNRATSNLTIFYGISGSGKTKMTHAIAYKMITEAGWKAYLIPSMFLVKTSDNQTLQNFKYNLELKINSGNKVLIIIDEIDGLFDSCYEQESIVDYFIQFLDKHKNNPNIHVIVTVSEEAKLPRRIEDLISAKKIKFEQISDNDSKIEIINNLLVQHDIKFDIDITRQYFENQIEQLKALTGRDLEEFVLLLKRVYRRHSYSPEFLISKEIFDETFDEYQKNRKDIGL